MTIGVLDGQAAARSRADASPGHRSRCRSSSGKLETVDGRKLGYVRLATFSEGVHARCARRCEKVREEGAEGLVLDLRGNGGGLLEEAVLSAEHLPARGRSRGDDRLAHPGPRRLRRGRPKASARTCRHRRSIHLENRAVIAVAVVVCVIIIVGIPVPVIVLIILRDRRRDRGQILLLKLLVTLPNFGRHLFELFLRLNRTTENEASFRIFRSQHLFAVHILQLQLTVDRGRQFARDSCRSWSFELRHCPGV